jgi:hypothetical protein
VKRHPNYEREARDCLALLHCEVKDRFQTLLEEYSPDDEERWRQAKAFDGMPFPLVLSEWRGRDLAQWQLQLWGFYERWRMLYPVPADVMHPHPLVLASLTPRPAEWLDDHGGGAVVLRLELRAPLRLLLSCLRQEVVAGQRRASIAHRTGASGATVVQLLNDDGRDLHVLVELTQPLSVLISAVQQLVVAARKAHDIRPGAVRERPDVAAMRLAVWDAYLEHRRSPAVGQRFGVPASTVRDLLRGASANILGYPPAAPRLVGIDPGRHIDTCQQCGTANEVEQFCRTG